MNTYKAESEEHIISKELMLEFLHHLDVNDNYLMKVAYHVAMEKEKGTYLAMFNEATMICAFGQFLLVEHEELLDKMATIRSLPMADLLNMPLTESEIKKYKTH